MRLLRPLAWLLPALAFSLSFASCSSDKPAEPAHEPPAVTKLDVRVSGPYTHDNLQFFLIHGESEASDREILTLGEALASKQAVVHETQNVNSLAVENLTQDKDIFIQAGDIVRGGQQDRVLATDMLLEPGGGKLPIASFCVEQGRWSQRGKEDTSKFSASENCLSSADLKKAVRNARSQERVWHEVANYKRSLGGGGLGGDFSGDGTSLELTLSNPAVKKVAKAYTAKLTHIIDDKPDTIGFASVINGKINSAEIYASNRLLAKLWDKMLRSAASEALAQKGAKMVGEVDAKKVEAFLANNRSGKTKKRWVNKRIQTYAWRNRSNDFYETADRKSKRGWIHRSFLAR